MPLPGKLVLKKYLNVIGCMTGTSLDGLDLAFCRIGKSGKSYKIRCPGTGYYPYPEKLRSRIEVLAGSDVLCKEDLKQTEADLCAFYAGRIIRFIERHKITNVDLIGSHGQTIFHHDGRSCKSGGKNSLTWQIGDGAYISGLTGIPTVSDFRVNDTAAGGSGAPLTPVCHYHLFGDKAKNTAVLNIGGITNMTYLPADSKKEHISASDCGPGNMIVDQLMNIMAGKKYDKNGRTALSGKVSERLLSGLKRQSWYLNPFPKSLGREQFGEDYIKDLIGRAEKMKLGVEDIIATASELTVICVEKYLRKFKSANLLVIAGGGTHNRYFTKRLSELFPRIEIAGSDALGVDPDFVEAIGFALLGAMFIHGDPAGLPQITGAKKSAVLGKLSLP